MIDSQGLQNSASTVICIRGGVVVRQTCCGALSGGDHVLGGEQDAGLLSLAVMRGRRAILRAGPETFYARFKWLLEGLRPISCKSRHVRRSCKC